MQTWLIGLIIFWGVVVLVMAFMLVRFGCSWLMNRRRDAAQQPAEPI